jgi:hypothetical protein
MIDNRIALKTPADPKQRKGSPKARLTKDNEDLEKITNYLADFMP